MDVNPLIPPSLDETAMSRRAGDRDKAFIKRGADRRAPVMAPQPASFPLALFSCDSAGAVVGYNEAAATLWGRHPHQSQTEQWSGALELLTADGARMERSDYPAARAFKSGEDVSGVKATILRPDGSCDFPK